MKIANAMESSNLAAFMIANLVLRQASSLVGKGMLVVFIVEQCERWFGPIKCSVFEEEETIAVFKIVREWWWN